MSPLNRRFILLVNTATRIRGRYFARTRDPATLKRAPQPPHPDSCCGSGCENCVYLLYLRELSDFFRKSGVKSPGLAALEALEEEPLDEAIRTFLRMEWKLTQQNGK